MKMDMLRLTGAKTVDFPLAGTDGSGPFVCKSAEGLGPPDVTVKMTRTVSERALYQGKTPSFRQVVILVGLQPDWNVGQTPEELRTQLYSLLTPKYGKFVRLEILYQGVVQAYAQGHVSRIVPAFFTKDPAAQITLDCDFAYFLKPAYITQEPPQVTVGGLRGFDVENEGDAPSGFVLDVILRANVGSGLYLTDDDPQGQRIQIEGVTWNSGDRLLIDTRAGTRGIWRGPNGGALVSVLNNMNAFVSDWMQLYGGTNRLILNTTAFDWNAPYKFTHQPAYWGV